MRKAALYFLAIMISHSLCAQPLARPKLVVGIVIDQMRWDYLYRYYERFGTGGFRRLMDKGYNCQNTQINYLPTFTAPGHASVYTGSVPSIHGIAANDWIDNLTGKKWYCTEDKTVTPIGGSYAAGQMSPRNLLATTITDELKLATNSRARVFGISLKDRGSILPAGHTANGAYWFDDSTGNFITSSYYGKQLPPWLIRFNNRRHADSIMQRDWEMLYPIRTYVNSVKENTDRYEGKFPGEEHAAFPHSLAGYRKRGGYYGLRYTPGGNEITFAAARACIAGEDLGSRNVTDFLCISFSATDYAGHLFSPDAPEMEDMYLRFDKDLASFLSYLDKRVGEGNYTIFLTADHGGAHNSLYLNDKNIPAGNSGITTTEELNKLLKARFKKDSLVVAVTNYQVYFNEKAMSRSGQAAAEVKAYIIQTLSKKEGVAYVVDMENRGTNVTPAPLREMLVNGYNQKRSGSVQVVLQPGWYSGYAPTGTTHGGWHPYDAHIPLLWYGWGIPKGETFRTVHITDIAPTLAALLHIQMPNGCIGQAITEITN